MEESKGFTQRFLVKKETKNTVVFEEERDGSMPAVIGSPYVQKWMLERLGNPVELLATVEKEGSESDGERRRDSDRLDSGAQEESR